MASTLQRAGKGTRAKSLICHLAGNGWVLTISLLVLRADAVVSQVFEHMLIIENGLQNLPQWLDGKERARAGAGGKEEVQQHIPH